MHPLHFYADDGEEIRLWRHGDSGPILVFLHGWTSSHLEWSPLIHDLARNHRVFRWDARAHGTHPPLTDAIATAARMARDLEQMIDHFELTGACFIGHSMGALTLWQYLRDHGSGKIGSLCFIDQSPKLVTDTSWDLGIYGNFDAAQSAQLIAKMRADFAEGVLHLIAHGLNDAARTGYEANSRGWQRLREDLRAKPAAALIACWEDLVKLDLRDVIPQIDRPSLFVHGGRSNFYCIETARWLAARVPGSQLSIHDDANHSPHLIDPPRFITELTAFIASATGNSRR